MAHKTTGHVFTRTRYPWPEWTDGDQWIIVKGEDYRISTHNMQITLHCRARMQDLKVQTSSFKNDREGLTFQYYKDDE